MNNAIVTVNAAFLPAVAGAANARKPTPPALEIKKRPPATGGLYVNGDPRAMPALAG